MIEKALGIEKLEVKSVEAVPDVDWVRITQAQFQPIQASRRLWIVPSWSEPPSPDALNMKLDPGRRLRHRKPSDHASLHSVAR